MPPWAVSLDCRIRMAELATQTLGVETKLPSAFPEAFRWMVLARTFEDKIANIYRAGKIVGGVYVGRGQEAFSVALAIQLVRGNDIYAPLIRDMAGRAAFGEPVLDAARTYLGSAAGSTRGRDGNIHRGAPRDGMPTMISHLGAMISVVNGMLLARRLNGTLGNSVGAACIGDGATSTGSSHEAFNMAAVERLPLVIAIANNQFAYSTPTKCQFACDQLADRAIGYGIRGTTVDGTDLAACLEAFSDAVARARAGEGPQMVVGDMLRLSGHGEHDDASYVPDELRQGELGKDCLSKAKQALLSSGAMDAEQIARIEAEAAAETEAAISQAGNEDSPDPYEHDWQALSTPSLRQLEPRP